MVRGKHLAEVFHVYPLRSEISGERPANSRVVNVALADNARASDFFRTSVTLPTLGSNVGRADPKLRALSARITDTLRRCFGDPSASFEQFRGASTLQSSTPTSDRSYHSQQAAHRISSSILLLEEAKRVLPEDLADLEHEQTIEPLPESGDGRAGSRRVFVVHGHDEAAMHGLARFLEKLRLEAIILKEQPDRGRTIIEKFEDAAQDVGFAVVLLTPDDLGGAVISESKDTRARQNVIFELGYFAGKLGRGRVCLLRKGHVEIPSDLYGVIHTEMDTADGWQTRLIKEFKAAKLDFDANRLWD